MATSGKKSEEVYVFYEVPNKNKLFHYAFNIKEQDEKAGKISAALEKIVSLRGSGLILF